MASFRRTGLELLSDARDRARARPEPEPEDDTPATGRPRKQSQADKDLVERAMDRFRTVVEAEARQREREREDLQFDRALVEDQWPTEIRKARQGGTAPDGKTVAERPCLVINKLDQPVQQVINEARQARLGIEIKAKGSNASTDGADLRQGMIRAIEQDSGAQESRLWALDRAVKCGRGYYRVLLEYANDGDFDLDIRITRILNQGCVYLDPHATQPDWSDGEYAFITEDLTKEDYERRYGTSPLLSASADELVTVTDRAPGWLEEDTIRVAEYFEVEHDEQTLIEGPSGNVLEKDWPEGLPIPPQAERRTVDVRTVKWYVINASEVVDEEDWPGRWIPILPVTGKEHVVDGDRCWKGMVSNAKDAQRSYNYMRSAQVEAVGLAPKAPWLMAEGQDEGFESMWDQANTRNFPRLVYKPTTFNGETAPPPTRNVAEPAIQAITLAVREADNDIKSTTGRFDPSLGNLSANERSGKAIQALKLQGEIGSSHYIDHLAHVSMLHEGRILLNLLSPVYGQRRGRIVRLLGDSPTDEKQVMLGQPFVPGPDGRPIPAPPQMGGVLARIGALMSGGFGGGRPPGPPQAPPGMPPPGPPQGPPGMGMAPPMPQAPPPPKPTTYDLSEEGNYGVQVTVGKSFATEREANMAMLETMIESTKGALAPMVMDLWAEQAGGPLGRQMAQRLRKANPALDDKSPETQIPPQIQQQMQQMQMQMQEMQKALQESEMKVAAQTEKAKADFTIAQMEIQSKEKIELLKIQAELAKTKATLTSKEGIVMVQAEEERIAHLIDIEQERRLSRDSAAHEVGMTAMGRAHDRESAHEDREHEGRMTQEARAHEARQGMTDRAHERGMHAQEREESVADATRAFAESMTTQQAEHAAQTEATKLAAKLAPKPAKPAPKG